MSIFIRMTSGASVFQVLYSWERNNHTCFMSERHKVTRLMHLQWELLCLWLNPLPLVLDLYFCHEWYKQIYRERIILVPYNVAQWKREINPARQFLFPKRMPQGTNCASKHTWLKFPLSFFPDTDGYIAFHPIGGTLTSQLNRTG